MRTLKWQLLHKERTYWLAMNSAPGSHYIDVIMGAMASQITSLTIVYSTVCSGAYQRKYQSPASLAFLWGIHRWLENSPHKWPATRRIFPFDDVIMAIKLLGIYAHDASLYPLYPCRRIGPLVVLLTNLPTGQDGRHFGRPFFICIFLNGNDRIPIQISLKYGPKSPAENKPALLR